MVDEGEDRDRRRRHAMESTRGKGLKAVVKRRAPRIAAWIQDRRATTVNDGWERYARVRKPDRRLRLGDEWTSPLEMGIDCDASEVVGLIDRLVIAPFLGAVDTALEIGAGGGRFTETLVSKARRVIASEVAPSMLPHLRTRFEENDNVECLLLDGQDLRPLADDSVDAVLSYGVFVHLQHWDIFNYLVEIRRVLVPGGRAVIQHANTFSDLGWKLFLEQVPDQVGHHKYPGSFTVMTPELFGELSHRAGLDVVDCVTDVVKRDAISLLQNPG
jgi:SAM-dependent methyltransferase